MTRRIVKLLCQRLQEPLNEIDRSGDARQVDPHQQRAAVAGVIVDDGVSRTALFQEVLLYDSNLRQRRLMLRVRRANLAALRMVALGITVDQDEVDVRDVRIGACTAPVERLRLETRGQAN